MQKTPLTEKQAWILETRRKMFDSKAMTLPNALEKIEKLQKSAKKANKLAPITKIPSKPPTISSEPETYQKNPIASQLKCQKSEIFPKKYQEKATEKMEENQIPEPGEWEFEDEGAGEYLKMMSDFDEKIEKKTKAMTELEKMDLEHKKLKSMSQRLAGNQKLVSDKGKPTKK